MSDNSLFLSCFHLMNLRKKNMIIPVILFENHEHPYIVYDYAYCYHYGDEQCVRCPVWMLCCITIC
jgi:hypothetical protein